MQASRKKQFSLAAHSRIKQKQVFDQLFAGGQSVWQHPIRFSWICPGDLSQEETLLQVGFSVPKRKFKRAHDRNLLKRRMREAFRLQQQQLQELCHSKGMHVRLLFTYQAAQLADFTAIRNAMASGLKKLCLSLDSPTPKSAVNP